MRLRFQSKHWRRRYAISMTPLIDVIFLLMIFFLMTINFQKPEGVLDNRLPQLGRRSSEDPTKDWETVKLRIQLTRAGGELRIHLQERILSNYEDLGHYLDQLPPDILIIVEPEDDVPYKHVIGVYNACLKSKKREIVFSISA
jgi:biopolymer transport protein ExbD